jgi:hypothetical protein
MKKSSKAALLSGLIFPGIGHIFLKEYLRGSALVVLSLAALSVVVTIAYQHALLIVDRVENAAVIVLVACWLAGIIDSYRLGAVQEKSDM